MMNDLYLKRNERKVKFLYPKNGNQMWEDYKKYSKLMLYLLSPAESLSDNDKIKTLDQLSAPDSPFQILALEQKLLLFLKLNDLEKAKSYISLIVKNPSVTSEQLERIKEVKELYGFD